MSAQKFSPAFFKRRRQSNARSVGRLRRGEIPFCGISFLPSFFLWAFSVKEKSGRTVTIGKPGFLFLRKPFRAQYPLFFCYRWRKRKAWQKKTPWFVSPSAEGDRRSRRLRRAFEKARAKLSTTHRRDAPINCNLYSNYFNKNLPRILHQSPKKLNFSTSASAYIGTLPISLPSMVNIAFPTSSPCFIGA